jgi:hypothetical protein
VASATTQSAARRWPRRDWSGASLEVFVPCNARWRRSRYPGRPASGRSRFGVSSRRRPARICMRPADPDDLLSRPCGFPLERIRCDEARVADALPQSVPAESVARTIGTYRLSARCLAWRRVDGLLLRPRTSSTARAGETGETGPGATRPMTHRSSARTSSRSRTTRTTQAPSLGLRRPTRVMRQTRLLRVAFRYPFEPCAAWPGDAGLPSARRPTALLGFTSLRRFDPADRVDAPRKRGG